MFLQRLLCNTYRIDGEIGRLKYTGQPLRSLRFNRCFPNQTMLNNIRSSSVSRFISKQGSRSGNKVKEKLKKDQYKISTIISNRDEQNYANLQQNQSVFTRNSANLLILKRNDDKTATLGDTEFVPGLILSNVMSLAPKIDELQASLSSCFGNTDVICITETWLSDRILDGAVNLPGPSITRRDRSESSHGGVCDYIKE